MRKDDVGKAKEVIEGIKAFVSQMYVKRGELNERMRLEIEWAGGKDNESEDRAEEKKENNGITDAKEKAIAKGERKKNVVKTVCPETKAAVRRKPGREKKVATEGEEKPAKAAVKQRKKAPKKTKNEE